MKVAALDLGTNSFLCLIAEIRDGNIHKILSDEVEIVRLGQDVNRTKIFSEEALGRAKACLSKFRKSIDLHQPDRVLAMATSAAREVGNAEKLFQIGKDLAIPMEIIPGDKEAEITFMGATSGLPDDEKIRVVVDIGGGSTEIIAGQNRKIIGGASVDVGGVRLTEMFFPEQPPTLEQIGRLRNYAESKLAAVIADIKKLRPDEIIAVAGTPTELASAMIGGFDAQKIEGMKISMSMLKIWREKFEKTTTAERIRDLHVSLGRADIILAGVLIQELILEMLSKDSLTVSTRGVRFGVALELAGRG